VKLNLLVNEISEIYLEVYKKTFPDNGSIRNDTNIRFEKKDMDKFFIFDKLMKRKITSYDERGE